MRILLTEGSGPTACQVATRLGELGHHVEVLASAPVCLTRFTRHVRRVHVVPPYGEHPLAWLEAACAVARARRIDVLFPTQEQVVVLSRFAARVPVRTVVPPFAALRRVQDKHSASFTLGALGLPQPRTQLIAGADELDAVERFPVWVKRPVSTASSGVRRAAHRSELGEAVRALGGDGPVLVQAAVAGRPAMVQAVADHGRLVAWHAHLRVREGAAGGAAVKESFTHPALVGHVTTLVEGLRWHGPIALDAVLSDDGPVYIDVNPRLVEPRNAWLAGVDLVAATLALVEGGHPRRSAPGRPGVSSHQLLVAILGAAPRGRRAVWRELADASRGRAAYAGSVEELTPLRRDPLAAVPVAAAAAATLAWPRTWRWFVDGAVERWALTPAGWSEILDAELSA